MSKNIISGEIFSCKPYQDAQYVGSRPWGSAYGNLKVYCQTLMPNIPMGPAKALPAVSLNRSMFCNSSECAITPMSTVIPQNYITAKSYNNIDFQKPHLDFGATIEILANDDDFQSVSITTNKDPSTFHQ